MSSQTIWGIHAGKGGEAHALFLKKNVVALGFTAMSNLSRIAPNRDAFKAAVAEAYPTRKPGAIPNFAGQLFRFVHEMEPGDLVAYPSKTDRQIHIGEITGGYTYTSEADSFPNLRPVKWLKVVPRLKFSQGALYEIGSAMSLFQIKNYADECRAVLTGSIVPVPVKEDSTVPLVQSDITESTRDFLIKTLAQELKGHPFTAFVGHLLNTMGYRTRISPEGTDGGIDIIAHKDELGFEPPIIKVQVKSGENSSIGGPEVNALYGNVDPMEFGLFVALGRFSNAAKQFARGKANLRLIDGNELVDLVLAHYDEFDSRYKGILPLKRVYVPDPDETTDE